MPRCSPSRSTSRRAPSEAFNADNPRNGEWHFVNLPLGAAGYLPEPVPAGDPLHAFVGRDDIVHALAQIIQLLEAPTDTPGFSRRQAVSSVAFGMVAYIRACRSGTAGFEAPSRVLRRMRERPDGEKEPHLDREEEAHVGEKDGPEGKAGEVGQRRRAAGVQRCRGGLCRIRSGAISSGPG